ncbi:hypothetical protein M427DRAFT_428727 [Gonapodya prolifera JEL478]|uniref:Uncharacterized protein n=1 Tax=Gonapodya prolifera (strain JEL478) TaxID=1344416 RepID=A0A139ATC2_GONPJ|nr:hypothetical protein M427DRAFT_428727 [Gonapodya prolifera JEL478]|eukprot:KXS19745.1 hypothetical protein M427DRAFT_428727 [Gonapodya prolifera JEL478]
MLQVPSVPLPAPAAAAPEVDFDGDTSMGAAQLNAQNHQFNDPPLTLEEFDMRFPSDGEDDDVDMDQRHVPPAQLVFVPTRPPPAQVARTISPPIVQIRGQPDRPPPPNHPQPGLPQAPQNLFPSHIQNQNQNQFQQYPTPPNPPNPSNAPPPAYRPSPPPFAPPLRPEASSYRPPAPAPGGGTRPESHSFRPPAPSYRPPAPVPSGVPRPEAPLHRPSYTSSAGPGLSSATVQGPTSTFIPTAGLPQSVRGMNWQAQGPQTGMGTRQTSEGGELGEVGLSKQDLQRMLQESQERQNRLIAENAQLRTKVQSLEKNPPDPHEISIKQDELRRREANVEELQRQLGKKAKDIEKEKLEAQLLRHNAEQMKFSAAVAVGNVVKASQMQTPEVVPRTPGKGKAVVGRGKRGTPKQSEV